MKKFLSLLIAVAMVMSLSAVAFAKGEEINDGVQEIGIDHALKYAADSNKMTAFVIEYGKAAYFPILGFDRNDYVLDDGEAVLKEGAEMHLISRQEVVDGLKVKVDYEQGKELVESVAIAKKYVENLALDGTAATEQNGKKAEPGYYYFIEFKTVAKETTSDADIVATVELNKSKKGDDTVGSGSNKIDLNYKVKDMERDITINVGYERSYYADKVLDSGYYTENAQELMVDTDTVGDSIALAPDDPYLLKFDYDDEVEFTFGAFADQNEGVFTVDVSGQGKVLLRYTTTLDDGIAAANPDAKIFALNFNNTKFNRTGEFTYEGEDFEYAYQVMEDGSLKLLGEFDGEEISFKTRVLGQYLFSDVELTAAPAAVEEPTVEVPTVDVTNPSTGAIA